MICVFGMLVIGNMAFNPEQIASFTFHEDEVTVLATNRRGRHTFEVDTITLEEQRAIMALWSECKRESQQ